MGLRSRAAEKTATAETKADQKSAKEDQKAAKERQKAAKEEKKTANEEKKAAKEETNAEKAKQKAQKEEENAAKREEVKKAKKKNTVKMELECWSQVKRQVKLLHEKKINHGDLHFDNIMCGGDKKNETYYIIDFGECSDPKNLTVYEKNALLFNEDLFKDFLLTEFISKLFLNGELDGISLFDIFDQFILVIKRFSLLLIF